MSLLIWTNEASSTLASSISSSSTTLVVQAGQGALFPSVGAGQLAVLALQDTSGDVEYVWLTGIAGDSLTVVRGKEGTTPIAFASGSRVEVRLTAGQMATFLQKNGGDTLSGTTNLNGVLALGSGGSIQGGEFTGAIRSAPGVTAGQITVASGQPMSGSATILTSSNVQASLPAGSSLALTGMVVFWAGSSLAVPVGWQVCDGTNGTPDLRDQFIFSLSVGSSYPTTNTNTPNKFSTDSQGAHSHGGADGGYALLAANLPSGAGVDVPFTFINLGQASGGSGTGAVLVTGNSTHSQWNLNGATSTPHSHSISSDGAHQHNAIPPYVGLLAIMKL